MTDWAMRIKQRREALGMSVAGLARACGIRPPSIHNWEGGRTKAIEGKNLVAAARALGVSPEWILTGRSQLTAAVATTSTEIVTISPRSGSPAPPENTPAPPPVDHALLVRSIRTAQAALSRADIIAGMRDVAELATCVYTRIVQGRDEKDAARIADEFLADMIANPTPRRRPNEGTRRRAVRVSTKDH